MRSSIDLPARSHGASTATSSFVELSARSSFSFLRGSSHPEEMLDRAKTLGLAGITLCDRDGLYGIARAHARAREIGQIFHIGAEVPLALSERELRTGHADAILGPLSDKQHRQLLPSATPNVLRKRMLAEDGYPTLHLIVKNLTGYQNLCWLLTRAHADLPKGECLLNWADLAGHCEGLFALLPTLIHPLIARKISGLPTVSNALLPSGEMDAFSAQMLTNILEAFGPSSVYSLCYRRLNRDDGVRKAIALQRERRHGIPIVASALPNYHCNERMRLADVVQCIRLGTTLSAAKTRIAANGQAYLRTGSQMARLFSEHPEWIERTCARAAWLM